MVKILSCSSPHLQWLRVQVEHPPPQVPEHPELPGLGAQHQI